MRAYYLEYSSLLCAAQFQSGAIPMSYTKQLAKYFGYALSYFFVIYHHISIEQGRAPKETNGAYTVYKIIVCVCILYT